MKQYVENKGFAKFLRTLGYTMVLFATMLTALELVFSEAANFILLDTFRELLAPVESFVSELTFLNGVTYIFMAFVLGMFLLVVTLKKSTFSRVFFGLITLFLGLILIYENQNLVLPIEIVNPEWLTDLLSMASVAFDPLLDLSEDFANPLISLLFVLITWHVFASKKPKRLSTQFVRFGLAVLFVAVLTFFASIAFEGGFFSGDVYQTIQSYAYFIALDLISIGSIFGILGLFRK